MCHRTCNAVSFFHTDGDVDFDEVDIEKKRGASGDDGDFSSEMKKMLECFGSK